ncbi:MAG: choice-of-anchor Q domain-containing protein [Lysobacter sp.]
MTRIVLLLLLSPFALSCASEAGPAEATHYVRTDGGTSAQCDGSRDRPYPGEGEGQPCAWRNPLIALPPGQPPRIAGGDTLIIGTGSYPIGRDSPDGGLCEGLEPTACTLAPIPGGPSSSQPTRILGGDHDRGCSAPPTLWATGGAVSLLNLEHADNVEIACLELTDHGACIKGHPELDDQCQTEGPEAAWGEYGIVASDSSQVELRDLDIHGMAVNGIRAGRIHDWTLRRVRLRANGWAGWDGNLDADDPDNSGNHGYLRFIGGEIAWNGCGERYPGGEIYGCWAQQHGGYGDGLGTARSGGDWLFEDMHIHHNTSDGLDLLYMDGTGSVTLRRLRVEGNAGNQIKLAGPATIENSIAVGNCGFFADLPGAGLVGKDHCRASGNTLSLSPSPGSLTTLRNNTITGEGDCLILIVGGDSSAQVVASNNALIGGSQWNAERVDRGSLTCGYYRLDSDATLSFEHNLFWGLKDDQCPSGNLCDQDPALTAIDFAHFDPTPLAGSPLIDAGMPVELDGDYFQHPRPAGDGVDIGAIELQVEPQPEPSTPAPGDSGP